MITIEGLAWPTAASGAGRVCEKHLGFQCGYCTPGMILGAYALLLKNPKPTRAEIVRHMEDHLCRCGTHVRVIQAVETAAAAMKEARDDPPDVCWKSGRMGIRPSVNRREFLKLTGTGLLVMVAIEPLLGGQEPARLPTGRQGYPTDLNAYVHIGADGRVTCLVGKVELGQGAMTSLAQLAAEELNVPLTSVDMVIGDTDLCPWDGGTYGSLSIRQFGPVLRAAAAEARAVLVQLASERLQVPTADLTVELGVVRHKTDPAKRVTYGQLTEGKRIERRVEGRPTLEDVKSFTIVGTSAPRRDAIEKVTGKAKYAGDIVPPGALHARVVRPPAHGATLVSVDTSAAEAVPGVRVVRDGTLVAVLHEHRDEADRALALVKAQFSASPSTLNDTTIFDHLMNGRAGGPERRSRWHAGRGRAPGGTGDGTHLPEQLCGPRGHGNAFGGGRYREGKGDRVGVHPDTVPGEIAGGPGPEACARKRPRDYAVCGRRVRRQERVASSDRGGQARDHHGNTSARGLVATGGVLLRHVPPGGRAENPLGDQRRQVHRLLGLPGGGRRRARRRAVLQHCAPSHCGSRRVERELTRPAPVCDGPCGPRVPIQRLRPRVASTSWPPRPALTRGIPQELVGHPMTRV